MRTNKGNSTTVAIIVILIILVAGGIYIWRSESKSKMENSDGGEQVENEIPSDETISQSESSYKSQSNSDDVNSIDADLKATSFDSI